MSDVNNGHRFEEVLAYEQGFLDDDESMEMELHLRGCSECRETLDGVNSWLPEMYPGMEHSKLAKEPRHDVYEAMMRRLSRR
jgi:anti-sigma factor ChrR (cupin superfamily)